MDTTNPKDTGAIIYFLFAKRADSENVIIDPEQTEYLEYEATCTRAISNEELASTIRPISIRIIIGGIPGTVQIEEVQLFKKVTGTDASGVEKIIYPGEVDL
jgi:uncharacterized protein related to proFAR isomerase